MILKTVNNENFTLTLKLDVNYELKYIEILVILDNTINHKRQMKMYHGNEFDKALNQYKLCEQFIF